LSNDIIYLERY